MEGFAYRLRPVCNDDAELIVKLRGDPELNRFLHPTSSDLAGQIDWLNEYYLRQGDWYFVIEHRGNCMPEGVVSIYNLDTQRQCAEWGRWILRKDSMAAVESSWLVYLCAFEVLRLHEIYCRTVADNLPVVSFHDSCGINNRCVLTDHFNLSGHKLDAVEHRVRASDWKMIDANLGRLAKRLSVRSQYGN